MKDCAERSTAWRVRRTSLLTVAALVLALAPDAAAAEASVVKSTEMARVIEQARKGNPRYQTILGISHLDGNGVPRDEAKGLAFLRKAADRGYALALTTLASHELKRDVSKRDAPQAMRWLEKAAEQGSLLAQMKLGLGHVPATTPPPSAFRPDAEKSYFWLTLAMLSEDDDAIKSVSAVRKFLMDGDLSAERIAAIDERLRVWEPKKGLGWKEQPDIGAYPCIPCLQRGADAGESTAQVRLGYLYDEGLVMTKDPVKAVVWHRRAAEQGNLDGQRALAEAYFLGHGVPQDMSQAHFWTTFVADEAEGKGWFDSDEKLRYMYYSSGSDVGDAQREEIEKKVRAWKPTIEKNAERKN